MATTVNYGLRKPEASDFYNISEFNQNADIIDERLKENADAIDLASKLWVCVLSAEGWTDQFPYTQTVSVEGMKVTYAPRWGLRNTGLSDTDIKAQQKAGSFCYKVITSEGNITAYAIKRPSVALTLEGRGI